jgi:hypothetical protein
MISIPKVVGLLSCGALLCLGLFQAAHAADQAQVIKGDLVRIDYGDYIVKDKDGKEVIVHVTNRTQMMGQLKKGDRVEAKVDERNHALAIRSIP